MSQYRNGKTMAFKSRDKTMKRRNTSPQKSFEYGRKVSLSLSFGNKPTGFASGLHVTTQQSHYIHMFLRDQAVSHAKFSAENDYDDKRGLRNGNLRLRGATTWHHFRFIVIAVFYPFLVSFVNQRTLFSLHNY